MKKHVASNDSDPGPRLHTVNQYLEKNFPDFFAEARFHVGNDDYFLYARFGKYLATPSSTGVSKATRSPAVSPC